MKLFGSARHSHVMSYVFDEGLGAVCWTCDSLTMKLFGSARHSHVMSYVFDEGLALFAGLNVIPSSRSTAAASDRSATHRSCGLGSTP